MAAPHQAQRQGRAPDAVAHRLLFETALATARRALAGHGLPQADLDDIAQDVVVVAYRRRGTYRPDRGNLEQWLCGIARNEVRAFYRKRAKQPVLTVHNLPASVASEAATPEDSVFLTELAEQVFESLPPDERRMVILRGIEGYTEREAAEKEGISPATAHARYQRGMAKLRKMAEERRASGVIPIPAAFAMGLGSEDAPASQPPPELVESTWRRVAPMLDLDEPPASEPPPSGTRRMEPSPADEGEHPPSSRPPRDRAAWLRRLGPIVGALIGGLIAGLMLERFGTHPHEVSPVAVVVPAPSVPSSLQGAAESDFPAAVVLLPEGPPPEAVQPPATGPAHRVETTSDRRDPEVEVLDKARSAIGSGNLQAGLAALAEHAERFSTKQSTARRREMWTKLCARYRNAPPATEVPELEKRCGGHP